MKKEKEEGEQAIGIKAVNSRHIRKRALRNKALAISFDDKDLKDFVGGFHKRKKKRRKEAEQQIAEKLRLKRIEKRKQRKQERAYVQGGTVLTDASELGSENLDKDEEVEPNASVADTRTYDAGNLRIMVTTCEISREEDQQKTHVTPRSRGETEKKQNVPVIKKQPSKTKPRHRSSSKLQKKREKRKVKVKKERRT